MKYVGQSKFKIGPQFCNHLVAILIQKGIDRGTKNLVTIEKILEMNAHCTHLKTDLHLIDMDDLIACGCLVPQRDLCKDSGVDIFQCHGHISASDKRQQQYVTLQIVFGLDAQPWQLQLKVQLTPCQIQAILSYSIIQNTKINPTTELTWHA